LCVQEIDYKLEGQNADRFRKNFGETPWIRVPRIFWEQTSSQVLTMEYTPGIKVNQVAELDARGIDRKLLAKRAVESYLQQLLTYGFFHAGAPLRRDGCLSLWRNDERIGTLVASLWSA
jgi:predicted unusual protein kinase regulating ubiquinone biosynthesis (AarF/ABC1/UbiB family)